MYCLDMKRVTQKKGDLAKALAIATFTAMGFDVAILVTESAPYDILVDTADGIKRVQVKYCSTNGVDLRKIHSNSKGYVIKLQNEGDYDWLYVYHPEKGQYLQKECVGGRQYFALAKMEKLSTGFY